jgi:hypothetical protein
MRGDSEPGGGMSGRNGFVPNGALGEATVESVRAPADADALDWSSTGGPCFACAFIRKKEGPEDPFNDMDAKDAYQELMSLIQDNYSRISNPELIKLIYGFYQKEIRPLGYDDWSPASISRHLIFHTNNEDVMMQEATDILYAQIQSLRPRTWTETRGEGPFTLEPNHKNILTMERLIRGLGDHLTKKKNRKNT